MNKRLEELLSQQHLMDCELEELEEMEEVVYVHDNGMSGLHCGSHYYSVELVNSAEYPIYVK